LREIKLENETQSMHDLKITGNAETPLSVQQVAEKCLHCLKCLKDCRFLSQHGSPGQLARQYNKNPEKLLKISFSCSLCNLCTQHCPLDLEPARMFLDLRKETVHTSKSLSRNYRRLLSYEKVGNSWPLKYMHIPQGATHVFFPGCALPGARPAHTLRLFSYLRQLDPTIGIMLDCCNKPSHDLGREKFFTDRFSSREQLLRSSGITSVITACTNCYQAFSLNSRKLKITTAYSVMSDNNFNPPSKLPSAVYTIHDPCSIRFKQDIHQAVRALVANLGLQVSEMEHNRATTLCCGEGGAAGCMGGGYAAAWSKKRHAEAKGQPLITYCAGCTAMLQSVGKVHHIVDLLFPEAGDDHKKPRQTGPPTTYINRIRLKWKLKKLLADT
jgi:Fe-S oxidoreductase